MVSSLGVLRVCCCLRALQMGVKLKQKSAKMCLSKALGRRQNSLLLVIDFPSVLSSAGKMNTVFPKDIPSCGVFDDGGLL